ncbi:aromatic/alkene monooxygenase hydroxylase FAD-binding subunit MmoC [Methylobacter sp. S3L5C]|uniref:aromatic/alkene monooxygenase hydroxylase FAD-binding subunit MmoC n=1 Tax=Methylobacter sp. S3L5C TaxID=2839024 RepID=UPI001FACA319|nr:FAD-binding oxidoreductase [Methylobacter sp. S3L5C]UOA06997.1 2Fe-2S iron-sulfur cluster binding domain-containing protein [Methylobacter sp. S3L5C]
MASTHQVTIVTQDDESITFECRSDEDVISAGLRQDIYLMASCREGGCATCKGFCSEGDYVLGKFSSQALPSEEEDAGEVLLCRCYPTTDIEVEVPYTYDRISFSPEGLSFEAEVTDLAQISSNVMRLLVRRIGDDKQVKFDSGQFFDLEIPGTTTTRSYSPANITNKQGDLEFLIRIVDGGKFSTYMKDDAKIGQKILVKGPSGIFGLKENGFTPRYFIAGGTGLAPILSMVRRMHEWQEPQKCVIYFGVNTEAEIFHLDELDQLAAEMPTLELRNCVWKCSDDWHCEKGSVVDILRRDLQLTGVKPDIYLCGPPGMVDATFAVCEDQGIPKDRIYLEKFLPSGS